MRVKRTVVSFTLVGMLAGIAAAQSGAASGQPLAVRTLTLPTAKLRQPHTFALQADGGILPLKWTLESGDLPPGIQLFSDGVLRGSATAAGEFAFVVFGAARTAGILSEDWAGLLTIAVALSMATTPFLLFLFDKLLASRASAETRAPDSIDERGNPVIIAGFGRFGQIVGRLLFANGIRAIVLDHDPEQIDFLRKFGYKVFYGDATRLDILRAAGAENACLLINAIDDVDDNLGLTDVVRQNFPNLPIIARARNVTHFVGLRTRGVDIIERETFESALLAARRALETLGVDRFRAREIADGFRRHNLATLDERTEYFRDEARVLSAAQAGRP